MSRVNCFFRGSKGPKRSTLVEIYLGNHQYLVAIHGRCTRSYSKHFLQYWSLACKRLQILKRLIHWLLRGSVQFGKCTLQTLIHRWRSFSPSPFCLSQYSQYNYIPDLFYKYVSNTHLLKQHHEKILKHRQVYANIRRTS